MLNTPHASALPPAGRRTPSLGHLLIVDDEVELMTILRDALAERGYEAVGVTSSQAALQTLQTLEFDLLLTDLMMPEMDGTTLLQAGLGIDPNLVGIIMTDRGTVQTCENGSRRSPRQPTAARAS